MGKIACAVAVVVVGVCLPATGAVGADGPVTVTHHVAMEGFATGNSFEAFAGRAVQDDGYNRNVVYEGENSPEYLGGFGFWHGTFTLIDRDGSTLTIDVDYSNGLNHYDSYPPLYERRSGDVVVTGGTGKFAGATGAGHAELLGSSVRLEGDIVLTLDP